MAKLISPRQRIEETHYSLMFEWVGHPGCGFSFPCDKDGNVDRLPAVAQDNLRRCLTGTVNGQPVSVGQVLKGTSSYVEPAVYECECCGRPVKCGGFTNTCACGADYNWSGQRLADRSQWGEETGESLNDILNIR